MSDDERAELIRVIVETLAEDLGLTPEQFLRRMFFRGLEQNPAWTIVPGYGCVDRHGARGLGQPPAHPAALDRLR